MPRAGVDLADTYRYFADREVSHYSPSYAALCHAIADDPAVLALISALPIGKQQPNLILGAVRWLGGPVSSYAAFRDFVLTQWTDVSSAASTRRTQTNEVGRCATLLPVLASLAASTGRPLALIEVGASAGLCLYPDCYEYRYGTSSVVGPAAAVTPPVSLSVECSGPVPVPAGLPPVVWRAGVDLNPLDVTDPDDVRWLESLVWPEQTDRLARLRSAVALIRRDPPRLVRGDLNDCVASLVASAPSDACVVVFHTAVLAYLDPADRARFAATMASLPARWISNESPTTFPSFAALAPPPPLARQMTLLALDGRPLAYATPHGQYLAWL